MVAVSAAVLADRLIGGPKIRNGIVKASEKCTRQIRMAGGQANSGGAFWGEKVRA